MTPLSCIPSVHFFSGAIMLCRNRGMSMCHVIAQNRYVSPPHRGSFFIVNFERRYCAFILVRRKGLCINNREGMFNDCQAVTEPCWCRRSSSWRSTVSACSPRRPRRRARSRPRANRVELSSPGTDTLILNYRDCQLHRRDLWGKYKKNRVRNLRYSYFADRSIFFFRESWEWFLFTWLTCTQPFFTRQCFQ